MPITLNGAVACVTGGGRGIDEATVRALVDQGARVVITGMRLVLPEMQQRGYGHIVNVSSMAGKMTCSGAAVYTASKFAVASLSHTVRAEIAGSGVSITTVLSSWSAGSDHDEMVVSHWRHRAGPA